MVTLKAPQGCNEVVCKETYRVVNGVVNVPEDVAHELLTKGRHGFTRLPDAPKQTEQRKVYAMKK